MSLRLKHWRLDRRGDTIVEVMVVLAVLGLAISISYATANTSLLDTRQAQENSQAAELVGSQVESLRVMAPNLSTDPNYIFINSPFCVGPTNNVVIITNLNSPPAACQPNTIYTITINYCSSASCPSLGVTDNTFKVQAKWQDVEGPQTDTDTLTYRVYQP
jgi:prepilin-type N-terminal cleavage/methylation domain-containing protein